MSEHAVNYAVLDQLNLSCSAHTMWRLNTSAASSTCCKCVRCIKHLLINSVNNPMHS